MPLDKLPHAVNSFPILQIAHQLISIIARIVPLVASSGAILLKYALPPMIELACQATPLQPAALLISSAIVLFALLAFIGANLDHIAWQLRIHLAQALFLNKLLAH